MITKLKAIIIDDEVNNVDNLSLMIERYCNNVSVVATACDAEEGASIIINHQPDLVFLDIEMPVKSGLDLLKSLPQHNFEVVFVTAHEQYGIQAVKFAAVDYLLKPIDIDELKIAVEKAAGRRRNKTQNLQLENLMLLLQQQSKIEHRIALPSLKETRFAKTDEILRCESSNNYTAFYLTTGEKLIVSKPIYEYEELLANYSFIRCHQSHLVNKRYIKSWIKEDGDYLLMEDKTRIPVSRQKRNDVKNLLTR